MSPSSPGLGEIAGKPSKEASSARMLVGLALQGKGWFDRVEAALEGRPLLPEPWGTLYSMVKDRYHRLQTDLPDPRAFYGQVRSSLEAHDGHAALLPLLDASALHADELRAGVAEKDLPGQVTELVRTLVAADAKRRREAIEADIRNAERSGDRSTVERLIKELSSLR